MNEEYSGIQEALDVELVAQAINAHGIFLKKAVREHLMKNPSIVVYDEEFPVSFPDQTSIDILAHFHHNCNFYLIIECKRAYTVKKSWIFFRETISNNEIKANYCIQNGNHKAIKIYPHRFGLEPFSEGIEIDKDKLEENSKALFKSGNMDTIHRAASQVCRGFLGFINKQPKPRNPHDVPYYAIPVIITTAPLYSCENNYNDVDLSTGKLLADLAIKKQPWIVLRHPYSDVFGVGFEDQRQVEEGKMKIEDRAVVFKETVFVVNSCHIDDFLLNCNVFNITSSL